MQMVIGSRYRLKEPIGEGSFGRVHRGEEIGTNQPVAIKIEQNNLEFPQLETESNYYKQFTGSVNIPNHHFFTCNSKMSALVVDLKGPSLENLIHKCDSKMSLKTVLMLAPQMISAIEYIHKKGIIHRDIKPDNFVIGLGKQSNQIYLIDFGLAKRYILPDGSHIHCRNRIPLTGTARYASISTLSGNEQSRRDDMESLAYVFFYLLKGTLPWMNIVAPNAKVKYDKILAIKMATTPEELCEGLPKEFAIYLNLVSALDFNEEPQYAKYRKLFSDLFSKLGYTFDYHYDWIRIAAKRMAQKAIQHQNSKDPNHKIHQAFSNRAQSVDHRVKHDTKENKRKDEKKVTTKRNDWTPSQQSTPKIRRNDANLDAGLANLTLSHKTKNKSIFTSHRSFNAPPHTPKKKNMLHDCDIPQFEMPARSPAIKSRITKK